MEVKRYVNNEEVLGGFPEVLWGNENIHQLFLSIITGDKEVGED